MGQLYSVYIPNARGINVSGLHICRQRLDLSRDAFNIDFIFLVCVLLVDGLNGLYRDACCNMRDLDDASGMMDEDEKKNKSQEAKTNGNRDTELGNESPDLLAKVHVSS